MTKTKPEKEQVIEDTDTIIYAVSEQPKIEIRVPLSNFLSTEAEDILADNNVNPEGLQDNTLEFTQIPT